MTNLAPTSWLEAIGRLVLSTALGALIGLDRELGDKAAGLRTNMLVSLGAALFVLIPVQSDFVQADTSALGRTIQGIITGVGFVGAGSVLREERVRGLTSAAAIWVSAGVGAAAGLGHWQLGSLATGFALLILRLVKLIERRL